MTTPSNSTRSLAQGLSGIRLEDVPVQAKLNIKRSILENLSGAVAARATAPYMRLLDESLRRPMKAEATVFGGGRDLSAEQAAFINASCAVVKEFIGGHRFSYGMPSIAAVPTAFALGEREGASGAQVLLAALIGYEAHARIGVATYPMHFRFHPHGTLGVFGSAGAAASLLSLTVDDFTELLNLVSVLAIFAHRRCTVEGGTVRNVYSGLAAMHGIRAVSMLRSGLVGVDDGVRTCFVETGAETGLREEELLEGLGSRFEVCRNYYKLYGGERHLHGSMDIVHALREELGSDIINKDSIASIVVHTHIKGARCKRKEPQNAMASQWSIPHGVAALLILGCTEMDLFSEKAVSDPEIQSLAQKIDVFEDPEYTKLDPAQRYTRLALTLKDGRIFNRTSYQLLGEFDGGFQDEVVKERLYSKCRWLFEMGGFADTRIHAIMDCVEHLEELDDIRSLTKLLVLG